MGHQFRHNTTEEVHILMVSFALQSHINPLLRFGKRLVSKGLRVTLAVTIDGRDLMSRSSASTVNSGVDIEFFDDGFPLDYPRLGANLDHYGEMLCHHGPIGLKELIMTRPGPKFSCVVVNPFCSWTADVADDLNIPSALLWIQPCIMFDVYYHFYNNVYEFPVAEDAAGQTVDLPGLPPLTRKDLPSFILPTNNYNSFPKMLRSVFRNLKRFKWVFINSFYDLEKDVIDSMAKICPICPVGPLVPPSLLGQSESLDTGVDLWKADDRCGDWLDKQAPNTVVYVSFGSLTVLAAQQIENIQTALLNLKKPFLWVVKSDAATGKSFVSPEFLEETKTYGLVVPWCVQTKVLTHPAIACFVTHCGWNSTIETIVAGVPMVGCPQWTDQPTNAKLVADILKVGVRAEVGERGFVSSEEFEKRVMEILHGPRAEEIRARAGELKLLARESVAHGGSSDRNIQRFVDEVVEMKAKEDMK